MDSANGHGQNHDSNESSCFTAGGIAFFDGTWGDVHGIGSVGCGRTFNDQCSCSKEIFVRSVTHSHSCAINDGLGKGGAIVRDVDVGDGPFQVGRQVVKQFGHFSEGWGQGRRRRWVVTIGQEFGVRVRGGDPSFGSDGVFRGGWCGLVRRPEAARDQGPRRPGGIRVLLKQQGLRWGEPPHPFGIMTVGPGAKRMQQHSGGGQWLEEVAESGLRRN